jgi:hypothetical protein
MMASVSTSTTTNAGASQTVQPAIRVSGALYVGATKTRLTTAYRLTAVLAPLLVVSSVLGILFGPSKLYVAYPAALAGLVGQDVVTLVVGLPLLLGSTWLARRGSIRGLLAWAGALFYLAYSYYFFVVGGFNALFPVYVVIVSASLYGLLSLVMAIDGQAVARHIGAGLQRRRVSVFFAVIVAVFVLMWGGMSIAAAAAGKQLDPVPHLVVAIDGAVLLPVLAVAAVKLWRRQAFGYVLAGVLLVKVTATGLTLAFTQALAMVWAATVRPFDAFLFAIFGLMALGGLALTVPYLRAIDEPEKPRSAASPGAITDPGYALDRR